MCLPSALGQGKRAVIATHPGLLCSDTFMTSTMSAENVLCRDGFLRNSEKLRGELRLWTPELAPHQQSPSAPV